MSTVLRGIVHGKIIELENEAGLPDAELQRRYPNLTAADIAAVRQFASVPTGLRHSFGAWADDSDELDKFLEWNRQQRHQDRRGAGE